MPEEVGACRCQSATSMLHQSDAEMWPARQRVGEALPGVGENSARAFIHCLADEFIAVGRAAAHRHKQRAFAHTTRVIFDTRNLARAMRLLVELNTCNYFGKKHIERVRKGS